jgi:hypothetical protein
MPSVETIEPNARHPNLLKGNPEWVKGGPSPNPGGKTDYQRKLQAAIEKQETPERVCAVIAAMHEDATAHEKFSPAAAKVYLQAVGVDLNKAPAKVDLGHAPKEVVDWLAENVQ